MWYVIVYDEAGNEIGQTVVPMDSAISVGSDPSSNIVIYDSDSFPIYAYIYLSDNYPVIEDASGGSTLLDGFPLEQPSYITSDNTVTLGRCSLYVYYDDTNGIEPGSNDAFVPVTTGSIPSSAGDINELPPPPSDVDAVGNTLTKGQSGLLNVQSGFNEVPLPASNFAPVNQQSVELGKDAVQAVETRTLKLIAREGYLDGKEFLLLFDEFFDLGRSRDVDLFVDDPSVSRVHARLTLEEGGTLLVQDLRSSNGTFINGKEIKRDIASLGDRIRFGEVPFLFTTDKKQSHKKVFNAADLLKSKKVIFVALGFVLLFVLMLVIKLAKQNKPIVKKKLARKSNVEENLKSRVAKLKSEALELTKIDKWDEAISKYREALSIIPDDKEVKQALNNAKFERRNYKIFQEALNYKNQMTHIGRIKSLAKFKEIEEKSQYYRSDLSPIIMDLKKELAKHYRDEGLARYKANYFKDAYRNLCKYFELDAQVDTIPFEKKYRSILKKLDRKYKFNKKMEKCTAKRYLTPRVPISAMWVEKARKALMQKYPDKRLANAVMTYFGGNPKDAILELQNLTKTSRGKRKYAKHLDTILELQSQLQTIIQSYEAGETEIQKNNIKGAFKEWQTVLTIDSAIIPAGIKSRYRKNVSNRLAQYYYQYGKKSLDLFRYQEAFDAFKKGLTLQPDDTTELREGIKKLEQKAAEFIEDAIQYQDSNPEEAKKLLHKVLNITMPDSPTHKKAQKALGL